MRRFPASPAVPLTRCSVILVAVVALVTGCSVISLDLTPRIRPLQEHTVEGHGEAKILLTDISGVLSEDVPKPILSLGASPPQVPLLVRLREELKKAAEDKKVRAVVLRLNTPGGTVTASDIVYQELRLFRKEAKIPIVAIMMDVAASGGYYVALAADRIIAHPTTVTGSIGVIMITANAEGLLDKIGVTATAIKSGVHKDMGSPFRPLTPADRAIFQSVIDDLYGRFVDKVATRRHLSPDTARQLADGRIYTAEQARSHGLVDQIGYMADAIDAAKRAAGLTEARVIVYQRPREYRATYFARSEAESSSTEVSVPLLRALAGNGPRFLYLWAP